MLRVLRASAPVRAARRQGSSCPKVILWNKATKELQKCVFTQAPLIHNVSTRADGRVENYPLHKQANDLYDEGMSVCPAGGHCFKCIVKTGVIRPQETYCRSCTASTLTIRRLQNIYAHDC